MLRNAFDNLATETKLEQVRVLLASINSVDFATGADLGAVETRLDTLNTNDFATESTLASVLTALGSLSVSVGNFPATQAISAAALPLPAGAATQTTLASILTALGSLAVTVSNFPASQTVTGPLTDTQLRATAVPVSGPLTDTQLRATAVPIDSELPAPSALTDTDGNPTVPGVGAYGMVWNGVNFKRLKTNTGDGDGSQLAVQPSLYNGATWDRVRSVTGDGMAATGIQASVGMLWTGSVYNRMYTASALGADAQSLAASPAVGVYAYNGTNWDRLRTAGSSSAERSSLGHVAMVPYIMGAGTGNVAPVVGAADGINVTGVAAAGNEVWNGTGWDRLRSSAAATGTTGTGVQGVSAMVKGVTNYNPLAAAVALGDGDAGVTTLATHAILYNGATFDRARSAPGTTGAALVSQKPATSGGLTISRLISAATTNATSVKGSAGQVYGWVFFNTSASTKYVKLYNKATAPTVGTDTPVLTIPVAAGTSANLSTDSGIALGTGIGFAITGAAADADATAVAAGDVIINLFYT